MCSSATVASGGSDGADAAASGSGCGAAPSIDSGGTRGAERNCTGWILDGGPGKTFALLQPDQLLLLIKEKALLRIQQRAPMARPMCSICHSAYTAECELQARAPPPASLACAANGPSLHRLCRSAGTCFTARACLPGFEAA